MFEMLSESEIESLEQFLLNRIDKDANTEGKDEGIIEITELDGLLIAIVSGPAIVQP